MEYEVKDFWERVKDLLKQNDKTQIEMSSAINIDYANLKQQIYHQRMPTGDICVKIAEYLNTSVEYLVTGNSPENKVCIELQNKINSIKEIVNN